MKHYITLTLTALLALGTLASCEDMNELNVDPTRMQTADPGSFLDPILYNVSSYNWKRFNGFTFHLMQEVVTTGNNTGLGWLYITDTAGDGSWTTYYRWLNNVRQIEQEAIKVDNANYQAVALTLKGWIYSLLVDSFGDIPMSEANGAEEGIFRPTFDTQLEVYRQIIADLDRANELYDETQGLIYNKNGELLYGTDESLTGGTSEGIRKWRKLANSLQLRVLLRALSVPELATADKLRTMLSQPEKYPIFESEEDEAKVFVSGSAPYIAPMVRPQDFTSYKVLSAFFIDNLKRWDDPRLPIFAKTVEVDGEQVYQGMQSGYDVVPSEKASSAKQDIVKAPLDLMMMSYAEVELIIAELIQRGIVAGDASSHYERGVESAMHFWGAELPEGYFESDETRYDGTLERIMLQKFYALFFCDYQQWFEYNRTGLPELPFGPGVPEGNQMPRRFKYPAILQRTNKTNYQAVLTSMGEDSPYTKLIWQK
jgi:hypothetical protein